MPVPDPGCLPGADETTQHTVGGEQFGVAGGQVEPVTEECLCGAGQLGRERGVLRGGDGALGATARAAYHPGRDRHPP